MTLNADASLIVLATQAVLPGRYPVWPSGPYGINRSLARMQIMIDGRFVDVDANTKPPEHQPYHVRWVRDRTPADL